jgi:hypothetical protein
LIDEFLFENVPFFLSFKMQVKSNGAQRRPHFQGGVETTAASNAWLISYQTMVQVACQRIVYAKMQGLNDCAHVTLFASKICVEKNQKSLVLSHVLLLSPMDAQQSRAK